MSLLVTICPCSCCWLLHNLNLLVSSLSLTSFVFVTLPPPPSELELTAKSNGEKIHHRKELLKFGNTSSSDSADKENVQFCDDTLSTLAWVICHFVGLVVERPRTFWHSMHVGRKLEDYVTASDLAFAVLLLEQHMLEWRNHILYQQETGRREPDKSLMGCGLLYKGGVAGKEAKARFQKLNLCFHANFYSRSCPHRLQNMAGLNDRVKHMVAADSKRVELLIDNHEPFIGKNLMKEIQDDILHRVFYYMNS